ncbi:hypothetical protein [Actinoalloteichus sp. AHMU CJ021]|uniref:hypothetical protein n=1 Tax=Actinoalloteichus sp. AHMU CJ021 TaxID=2072503 RepID=UPI00307C3859
MGHVGCRGAHPAPDPAQPVDAHLAVEPQRGKLVPCLLDALPVAEVDHPDTQWNRPA